MLKKSRSKLRLFLAAQNGSKNGSKWPFWGDLYRGDRPRSRSSPQNGSKKRQKNGRRCPKEVANRRRSSQRSLKRFFIFFSDERMLKKSRSKLRLFLVARNGSKWPLFGTPQNDPIRPLRQEKLPPDPKNIGIAVKSHRQKFFPHSFAPK